MFPSEAGTSAMASSRIGCQMEKTVTSTRRAQGSTWDWSEPLHTCSHKLPEEAMALQPARLAKPSTYAARTATAREALAWAADVSPSSPAAVCGARLSVLSSLPARTCRAPCRAPAATPGTAAAAPAAAASPASGSPLSPPWAAAASSDCSSCHRSSKNCLTASNTALVAFANAAALGLLPGSWLCQAFSATSRNTVLVMTAGSPRLPRPANTSQQACASATALRSTAARARRRAVARTSSSRARTWSSFFENSGSIRNASSAPCSATSCVRATGRFPEWTIWPHSDTRRSHEPTSRRALQTASTRVFTASVSASCWRPDRLRPSASSRPSSTAPSRSRPRSASWCMRWRSRPVLGSWATSWLDATSMDSEVSWHSSWQLIPRAFRCWSRRSKVTPFFANRAFSHAVGSKSASPAGVSKSSGSRRSRRSVMALGLGLKGARGPSERGP
mmetsp:Transcript_75434/g.213678  ORF Transcript_75434/g.213678 Transcript_75434/m.213678 type:complete len:448 (-) Transcript_75434:27-1370(-)